MITAMVPSVPPSDSEPTSPMNISAGCALYQRKPREAPTSAPQKTVSSPTRGNVLNFQIGGPAEVAAHVGQHGQRAGRDHRATNGQAIQSIGQVHGIRRADDHDR